MNELPRRRRGGAEHAGAAAATRVFFATNRERIPGGGFGNRATPGEEGRLWLGSALLGTAADPEAHRPLLGEPAVEGIDDFADPPEAEGSCAGMLRRWLDLAAARGAMPLLFVHGFQNGFRDALARAAQITEFYAGARPGPVVLAPLVFSWPSPGTFSADAYLSDRTVAAESGPALGRLLRALAEVPEGPRHPLRLIAHSMGNWALQHGVQALRADRRGPPPAGLFRAAILAAADTQADALTRADRLGPIAAMADRVTVAIHIADAVLATLSGWLLGSGSRLGCMGAPRGAALPGNVTAVEYKNWLPMPGLPGQPDVPVGGDGTPWNTRDHQYYRNCDEVRDDLARALRLEDVFPGRKCYAGEVVADRDTRKERWFFYAT